MEGLVSAHFEGGLDEAGAARLTSALEADARARDRFNRLVAVEGLLRARAADGGRREALAARVMRSVRDVGPRRSPPRRMRRDTVHRAGLRRPAWGLLPAAPSARTTGGACARSARASDLARRLE
jgi:hypothetical protein